MKNLFGTLDNIARQNDALKIQNKFLREQNELLWQSSTAGVNDGRDEREVFVENIDRDEMRSGFLVTSHKKKLWNVQIGLLNEFARICKKHNLRWFAYAGTLIGAARHKGFIPWDDDVDIVMFRPDYEKFKRIIEYELKNHPYYRMWYWFNYRLETDSASEYTDLSLPLISKEQEKKYSGWAPFHPLIRMLDIRTMFVMPDDRKNVFSNIWIDIMSIDPCPPFSTQKSIQNFKIACELLIATVYAERVKKALKNKTEFITPRDEMWEFVNLPYKIRALGYEEFLLENFFKSDYVSEMKYHALRDKNVSHKRESFDKIMYLPFEKIEISSPVDYDLVLTEYCGDWRKPILYPAHSHEWSTDISFDEYRKKSFRFANTK